MRKPNYEPLKITAHLMSPVIVEGNMPLDAILGAATVEDPELKRRARAIKRFRKNIKKYGYEDAVAWWRKNGWEIPPRHFMPLAVYGHGVEHGLWVYHASAALIGENEQQVVYFHKRLDVDGALEYVSPRNRKVATAKGEYASKRIPFLTTAAERITWYALGEYDEIELILSSVLSIGKKRRRGYGRVRRWEIERIDDDRSVWRGNEIMRPVPARLLSALGIAGDFEMDYTGYRPPYWSGRCVAMCAVSGRIGGS